MTATRAELRSRNLVRAVPVWAWLCGIVVLSAAVRFALARRTAAPSIMVDELIYSELAKSFADGGRFLIRDVPAGTAYGVVYPLLISPAYRLFGAVPDAYEAAKAINAVVMSLAAVPAYFLARRVASAGAALVVAALSVAIPSLLYVGNLMTENAFYPLFLCVAVALVHMLERPTWRNQLGVLVLCVVAYETRRQGLALFPAVLTAPLLLGWRGLARFRVLYLAVAAVAAVAVLAEVVRGRSPLALLGAYEAIGRHDYSVGAVAKWLVWHAAELDLYLGVVPAAAFVLVALSWQTLDARARSFVAAASALSAWLVLEVAAFASLPGVTRIEERNLFYLAPFFLTALLLWIERGAPRPRVAAPVAAAACALLVGALAFAHVVRVPPTADTLALMPLWRLHERGLSVDAAWLLAFVAAVGAAAAFLFVPRRFAFLLPVLVLVYFVVAQQTIERRLTSASRAALAAGIRSVPPDWIDRRVGRDADVAAIWTGRATPYAIWQNEFFNRSVGRIYHVGSAIPGGLASTRVTVDRDGSLPIHHRYVLVDGSLDLEGAKVAGDAPLGMSLWDVRGRARALTRVTGLYPGGTWSGRTVEYRRRRCDGGAVRVTLLGDAALFERLQMVRADGVSRLVVPGHPATTTVPLTSCRARFTVTPTTVPGNGDSRRLGVHFLSFEYVPRH